MKAAATRGEIIGMQRVAPEQRWPLHGSALTRQIEENASASMPAHTLMERAGESGARLARALYPHARRIWVACGPGNNGGDGLIAAMRLIAAGKAQGLEVTITLHGDPESLPADAAWALARARTAGLTLSACPPTDPDLVVDALLGLGLRTRSPGPLDGVLQQVRDHKAPVLCIDVPSGLHPDTGAAAPANADAGPRHTLSLLTLKPGLFTHHGRDRAGEVWIDDLGVDTASTAPCAWLGGFATPASQAVSKHAAHKGSHGDVAVLGGQTLGHDGVGMSGAAVLAAKAALHAGAGRVYLTRLGDGPPPSIEGEHPELMLRSPERMLERQRLADTVLVAGCGGGNAIVPWLSQALSGAPHLVADADALNAIANDTTLQFQLTARARRGWTTVLTPHPLEAARLLQMSTPEVMADRLAAAQGLADRYQSTVVLKGSGSVVAAPGATPWLNATGNALLATAGTGDVLAGMLGAALARSRHGAKNGVFGAVCAAVAYHGALADGWARHEGLTASALSAAVHPI